MIYITTFQCVIKAGRLPDIPTITQTPIWLFLSFICCSKRLHSPLCSAAAVASDLIAAPTNTPCCQSNASYTRGTPGTEGRVSENHFALCACARSHTNNKLHKPLCFDHSPCGLRPPKMIASIGTPSGDSHWGSMMGHWLAGVQKRELGCALGSPGRWWKPRKRLTDTF